MGIKPYFIFLVRFIASICLCLFFEQEMAKAEGLWNLFLPAVSGLSQFDYALIAEETGKSFFAPEIFNCHAPG